MKSHHNVMNYYNEYKRTRMCDPLTQFSTWVTRVWAGSTNRDVTNVGGANRVCSNTWAGSSGFKNRLWATVDALYDLSFLIFSKGDSNSTFRAPV